MAENNKPAAKAEKTAEELQLEVSALTEQLTALTNVARENEELKAQVETLTADLEELSKASEKGIKAANTVPGKYTSKEHKVSIRFKDGCVKTRVEGKIVDSTEIIKNKGGIYTAFLDNLIAIEAGVIEIIK